jgi:hypothetical protein
MNLHQWPQHALKSLFDLDENGEKLELIFSWRPRNLRTTNKDLIIVKKFIVTQRLWIWPTKSGLFLLSMSSFLLRNYFP